MKSPLYYPKIKHFTKLNPNLRPKDLSILLLIDNIYKQIPKDLKKFMSIYTHLDPSILENESHGIIFLDIVKSKESPEKIKEKLNEYINIKYNYIGNFKTYKENMIKFKHHSKTVSTVIEEILKRGQFPEPIINVLQESKKVKEATDFYEILQLFKTTNSKKVQYEILRKIGLIVLLSRINRTYLIQDIDQMLNEMSKITIKGLGLKEKEHKKFYFFLDEKDNIIFHDNEQIAKEIYEKTAKKRKEEFLEIYPMEVFNAEYQQTKFGTEIVHADVRNKFKRKGLITFTSIIEKIIRKNLEYPNQVHDIIGVRLLVETEQKIPQLISHLETFLGGRSTRKKEKNTLNKFGKKKLTSEFSSEEYYVWKSIYDITLPHPSIYKVQSMLNITRNNIIAQDELIERLEYFKDRPKDVVVEVQIQELRSFLRSIAKGSPCYHGNLKIDQIRSNSFYKLFPKEIYESELNMLRKKILKG